MNHEIVNSTGISLSSWNSTNDDMKQQQQKQQQLDLQIILDILKVLIEEEA